jgi:hypothetical protein
VHPANAPQTHIPAALQLLVGRHVPQLATVLAFPQLSAPARAPQVWPSRAQKLGSLSATHPHWFGVLAPHVSGMAHMPQLATVRTVPQLSGAVTGPQLFPRRTQKAASVSGAQPHWFGVLAPHVCGGVHEPQVVIVRLTPQWSVATIPLQFFPSAEQRAVSDSETQASDPASVCDASGAASARWGASAGASAVVAPSRATSAIDAASAGGKAVWSAVPSEPASDDPSSTEASTSWTWKSPIKLEHEAISPKATITNTDKKRGCHEVRANVASLAVRTCDEEREEAVSVPQFDELAPRSDSLLRGMWPPA